MITAGIDIGSSSTKCIILDEDKSILSGNILQIGRSNTRKIGERSFELALADAGLKREDINYIIATGYGRINASFADRQVTEITCHGKGAHHMFPDTRIVIDIGGQDSKVIHLDAGGEVLDFAMNDKCAAGTGRFLEIMAQVLEVDIEELGELSLGSKKKIEMSNMCTVFVESEVVSLIAEGHTREDVAAGIHNAIVERVLGLAHRIGIREAITLTGGVNKNTGILQAIKQRLALSVNIPDEPQIIGALGAALIAQGHVQLPLKFDLRTRKITELIDDRDARELR